MSTLTSLPGSGSASPILETAYEDFGDIEASQGAWNRSYLYYCAALQLTGAGEAQNNILAKADTVFANYQLQANKEARGTIELCDTELKGKGLMRSEDVATLVELKAIAQIQLRDFDGAINTCNLSLRGKFKNIPYAIIDRIKNIQNQALSTKLAAQGLVVLDS